MYCRNCGQQLNDDVIYCPYCGTNTAAVHPAVVEDAPNAGFTVLGFFFPLVGLILYLVYESTQPKRAKSAGKGAIIAVITWAAMAVIIPLIIA